VVTPKKNRVGVGASTGERWILGKRIPGKRKVRGGKTGLKLRPDREGVRGREASGKATATENLDRCREEGGLAGRGKGKVRGKK